MKPADKAGPKNHIGLGGNRPPEWGMINSRGKLNHLWSKPRRGMDAAVLLGSLLRVLQGKGSDPLRFGREKSRENTREKVKNTKGGPEWFL